LWTRIFVLARYAFDEAWSSKITVILFVLCLLPPVVLLFQIYIDNNPAALMLIGKLGQQILVADATFFLHVLQTQSWLALVLASWIAPRLITFDLADGALPILLSHPISRFGYLFGKFIALFSSLSVVTWVPCLLLFAYQTYSSPVPWAASHIRIAVGLFAGSVLWIAFLSIVSLALSSWVKWRAVVTGIIFAAVLVPAGVGGIVTGVLHTKLGFLLNLPIMMSFLWQRLLGAPEVMSEISLPSATIAAMLALACCLCVAMLNARIRAREVVRG
jgi:ABC-type transport system involved in multi-copper enzyme maturation permease subunit